MNKADGNTSFYAQLGPVGLSELVEPAKTRADLRFVLALCRGGRDVIDIGCGYGRIAVPLGKAGLRVRGIDLDPQLIAAARRAVRGQGLPVRFAVGDMRELPAVDAAFDRALCLWSTFQHLLTRRDQVRALAGMHRVLRPGGRAFIEMVDGVRLRRHLARHGRGRGRRVLTWPIHGAEITTFIHDGATLAAALAASPFSDWRIERPRIHGIRRLVAYCWR